VHQLQRDLSGRAQLRLIRDHNGERPPCLRANDPICSACRGADRRGRGLSGAAGRPAWVPAALDRQEAGKSSRAGRLPRRAGAPAGARQAAVVWRAAAEARRTGTHSGFPRSSSATRSARSSPTSASQPSRHPSLPLGLRPATTTCSSLDHSTSRRRATLAPRHGSVRSVETTESCPTQGPSTISASHPQRSDRRYDAFLSPLVVGHTQLLFPTGR
jgi:hypothetical protein